MATINDFYKPHGEDGIIRDTNFSGFSKTGKIIKGRGAARANANPLRASIYNDIEIQDIARSYGDRVAAGVEFFNQQKVQQQVAEDYGNRVAEGIKFFKDRDRINAETADYNSTMEASDNVTIEPKRATIDTPAAPKPVVKSTPLTNSTISGMIYEGNLPQAELDANFEEEFKKFSSNPENIKMAGASQSPDWNEKVLKAKGGGWGSKMKKAGAIGLGAIVAGGVIANLMGNGGQQTNAQLYGQQPIY